MEYPTPSQADRLFQEYPVPRVLLSHSQEVSSNCGLIGAQIIEAGTQLDLELLKIGGFLHDIGRWKYDFEKGVSPHQDFHEYETGRLLAELGYADFGNLIQRHALGGLTPEETSILGYPEAVDLMPNTIEAKIISVADKIRPQRGIITLSDKIRDYQTSERMHQRYFNKLPGLLETTVVRVTAIWQELEELGMKKFQ
ncbi:MAG TPA: HD domain-containing protein [Candidatus Nanoarchaeia archaeon]|nr:HD domain-containing protein [Candidatus Nanoarchaeia archaeon]